MANEIGYLVCHVHRRLHRENDTDGEAHTIEIKTHCDRGDPVALVHTHNVNPNPSGTDLRTSKDKGLIVCVTFNRQTKCYRGV